MTIWFTADQHFLHKNVIRYCNRPFKNLKEMHSTLIENHNNHVKSNDICYHIGDFSFISGSQIQKIESIISKLNGRNILILGNHDDGKPFTYVNMGFESVHTSLILPIDNSFVLSHDPAVSCIDRTITWLVGHVHDLFLTQKNCINVGVDVWNFTPISFEKIKEISGSLFYE